jgi:ABC-type transport system involved in cytochrome c biogenesis permease subunit
MKDLTFTLTGKRLRSESFLLLACLTLANGLNAYAIVSRKAPWSEMFTCLPFVTGLALVFYGAWAFVRLVGLALGRLRGRRR